ncbi:peptidylprolyl isomerase [Roseateles toxinivorans]|uniref:peptidylprolyl isomerase n=1 Tax=Roseateles toxinivorans TaxID=270368 RepID=A0A4R6QID9_9BURK|nr:peptidylprolyl isomerase [Roseateles toxinivorans]TDP62277.1 peptidyl-prolyl cis-trans isomerase C [Roseateles toxinivorans]
MNTTFAIPTVNGVPLHGDEEQLDETALRQRACTELLRQAAVAAGFDSAKAGDAIEQLLERELKIPEPSPEACRRHFEAHPARYGRGERLQLRHLLFAVTPGVDVQALRQRAEAKLYELRCADPDGDVFGEAARQWSNCPSGEQGGDLGWVGKDECATEFAREVFGQDTVGVLPRLVHSRFGLHIVEVRARDVGTQPAFEEVHQAVALVLRQQAWVNALRQYLQVLAGAAELQGVSLDAAETPLVQ